MKKNAIKVNNAELVTVKPKQPILHGKILNTANCSSGDKYSKVVILLILEIFVIISSKNTLFIELLLRLFYTIQTSRICSIKNTT